MAKRTPSDPQAQPKLRRSRSTREEQPAQASEIATAPVASEAGDDAPLESMTAESDSTTSASMASEPSEEDIRMRAYHRYLERGGGHGMDFEDWLEAERELRNR